jgi:hypothetical protein
VSRHGPRPSSLLAGTSLPCLGGPTPRLPLPGPAPRPGPTSPGCPGALPGPASRGVPHTIDQATSGPTFSKPPVLGQTPPGRDRAAPDRQSLAPSTTLAGIAPSSERPQASTQPPPQPSAPLVVWIDPGGIDLAGVSASSSTASSTMPYIGLGTPLAQTGMSSKSFLSLGGG